MQDTHPALSCEHSSPAGWCFGLMAGLLLWTCCGTFSGRQSMRRDNSPSLAVSANVFKNLFASRYKKTQESTGRLTYFLSLAMVSDGRQRGATSRPPSRAVSNPVAPETPVHGGFFVLRAVAQRLARSVRDREADSSNLSSPNKFLEICRPPSRGGPVIACYAPFLTRFPWIQANASDKS